MYYRHAFVALLLVNFCTAAFAQPPQVPANEYNAAVHIAHSYIAQPNIAYVTAQNYQAKLDIYRPAQDTASPVVIYIHGGGWVNGTKEDVVMETLPFMAMGFAVINVEYRLARISPAPAAVEDCLCVLHWVGTAWLPGFVGSGETIFRARVGPEPA